MQANRSHADVTSEPASSRGTTTADRVPNNGAAREVALALVSDAVILADAGHYITFMNPAAERLTGWPAPDAIGKPLAQVFQPLAPSHRSGSVVDAPLQATLSDRRGFRIAIEYRQSAASAGGVDGFAVVARDVTRRRATEIALVANEKSLLANADALFAERERAQVTLNSIGDAVISVDFRGRVTYLNGVAEAMTGWMLADAAGMPLDRVFSLVDADSRRPLSGPTMAAIIENRTVNVESPCVLLRRQGDELPVEHSAAPIRDRNGGVSGAVIVAHDVTAARELERKLARLALHDSLTDLPNRTLFAERMSQALLRAQRHDTGVALLYVDLDGFKQINDSLGHEMGDMLLRQVAGCLQACVRSSDTVGRMGGDEFVLLLVDVHASADIIVCAEKILHALSRGVRIGDHDLHVTASIGIALYPAHASDAESLLRHADAAMYGAKEAGRASYRFYGVDASRVGG